MVSMLVTVAALSLARPAGAAEQREAVLWQRLVGSYSADRVANAMSAAVRRPGVVGGVKMPAIFLHPQSWGAATISYYEFSVGAGEGMFAYFVAHVGIADGMKWNDQAHPADGARFYVTVSSAENLTSAEVRENRWTPIAARAGRFVPPAGWHHHKSLVLATDCGTERNANYDWAMFGDPMVVLVPSEEIAPGAMVAGASGIVVAAVDGASGKLVVEGLDANGAPIADATAVTEVRPVVHPSWTRGGYASKPASTDLTFVRFDFSDHRDCVQWRWRAEGVEVASAHGGSWKPRLRLEHCGPARAVSVVGEPLHVRVAVRNKGLGTLFPDADAYVECNGKRKRIGQVSPEETKTIEFVLDAASTAGAVEVRSQAKLPRADAPLGRSTASVTVLPRLPTLPRGRPDSAEARKLDDDFILLQNRHSRWLVCTKASGLAALLYVWVDGKWEGAGSVAPWAEVVPVNGSSLLPTFAVREVAQRTVHLVADAEGVRCELRLEIGHRLPALRVEQRLRADEGTVLLAFRGPAVCAGDRFPGVDKGVAMFPGLEYLEGDERSSSERDLAPPLNKRWTPHKFKVTVPTMLVETRPGGPVVGVAWDPNQKWDGEQAQPAASFASPNFLTHQDNHLMQLMLPATPDFVPENERQANRAMVLGPDEPWQLTQFLLAGRPEPDATNALKWVDQLVGFPEAEAWPRSFEEEMDLCRHGFLKTVWDEETNKSRHVVGWAPANAPGFATLMLMDARTLAQGDDKRQLLDRVKLIADQTVAQEGASGLASSALCHVMGWELPFHWGHLPEALAGMKQAAYNAITSQEADGGWGYRPGEKQEKLGARGTRVVGIAGRNAYLLAKWVAISGDPLAEQALRRALKHMERYRVPRGAQGWECPILEPDVLASAYAVRAYVWAHMALGEERWLEKARFWARTGLPFQYAWDDGQHPGMRYASIPVFGSTHFTHSWIGLPVQWCGLVYAYGLTELSRFDRNDLWRKQIEGIVASAVHQQWPMDNAELAGSYPDSYGNWFTTRNPVHIGPESIALNILAMRGHDPGLRSMPVRLGGGLVHLTAPADVQVKAEAAGLQADLKYAAGATFYTTLAPVTVGSATTVRAGRQALPHRDALRPGETGWMHNPQLNALVVGLPADANGEAKLTITGIRHALPQAPPTQNAWEFDRDTAGWVDAHSCTATHADGTLVIQVTGPDPYAVSGETSIPAARCKKLRARVRLTGGSQIGLFWRSSVSPGWGPDKEVHADCPGDGKWREVVFDLSQHALWAGNIVQIRLDAEPPNVREGTVLEVDWLRPQ